MTTHSNERWCIKCLRKHCYDKELFDWIALLSCLQSSLLTSDLASLQIAVSTSLPSSLTCSFASNATLAVAFGGGPQLDDGTHHFSRRQSFGEAPITITEQEEVTHPAPAHIFRFSSIRLAQVEHRDDK